MSIIQGGQVFTDVENEIYEYNRTPLASAAANILATTSLTGAVQVISNLLAQPDVPRNVTITGSGAGATGNVVITGYNVAGQLITETIVATGAALVAGLKAFASILTISLPAGSNGISVGVGSALGLNHLIARNTVLKTFYNGVIEGTAPTVVANTSNVENNTIVLNTALAGANVVCYYIGIR